MMQDEGCDHISTTECDLHISNDSIGSVHGELDDESERANERKGTIIEANDKECHMLLLLCFLLNDASNNHKTPTSSAIR